MTRFAVFFGLLSAALHHALKHSPDDALVKGLIKESTYSTLNVVLSQLIPASAAQTRGFHFARVFRKVTGQSPLGYLQTVRVQRARELAKSKKHLSKLEIALSVGFQSTKQLKYHERVVGRANRP